MRVTISPRLRGLQTPAGFTLVEVTAASLIAVTLSAVLLQMVLATSNGLATVAAKGLLQMELTQATDTVLKDVRLAVSFPGNHVVTGFPAFVRDLDGTNGTATVIIQIPSLDATTGNTMLGTYDYVIYTFNNATNPRMLTRLLDAEEGTARATTGPEPDETRQIMRTLASIILTVDNLTDPKDVTMTMNGTRIENRRTYPLTLVSRATVRN